MLASHWHILACDGTGVAQFHNSSWRRFSHAYKIDVRGGAGEDVCALDPRRWYPPRGADGVNVAAPQESDRQENRILEGHKLRVRIGRSYNYNFTIDLGQRNASFIRRPLTPLKRYVSWGDAFAIVPDPGYDLVHSHDAVPLLTLGRPYVITFESYLPRVPADRPIPWLERRLRAALHRERCLALISQSEYAVRQFRWQNRRYERLPELLKKVQIVYPGVKLKRADPKGMSASLRLLFVGKDFMRKGGPALLRAHATLSRDVPVETTVVSSLRWRPDDYIGPPSASYVETELRGLGQRGVTLFRGLPNDQVLELMLNSDFLVFPTLHDTFGYVSLEALSCGTPVITTRTCAQPEIVEHGVSGYLLPFENDDEVGKWPWIDTSSGDNYLAIYDATIARLTDALVERLRACWENRRSYECLSAGALERVRTRFDRDVVRGQLEDLYERCRPSVRRPRDRLPL